MAKKIIFTKHALERLNERYFKQSLVESTIYYPDTMKAGKNPGSTEYVKKFDNKWVTAIVSATREGDHLVLSTWIDPPFEGTKDARKRSDYKAYQKKGFWGRFFSDLAGIFKV